MNYFNYNLLLNCDNVGRGSLTKYPNLQIRTMGIRPPQ